MPPKRIGGSRWPQIRLRTLLVGIALLAMCLSVVVNGAHRERSVIAALRARGAHLLISIPQSWPGPLQEQLYGNRLARWILKTLGDGYLEHLHDISLPASPELAKAKSVSRWLHLQPDAPPGNDADLQLIGSLPRTSALLAIDLSCTCVTDTGLRHLAHLPNLRRLELCGTDIDGRGLSYLGGLTELSSLRLDSTNINDAGLQSMPELPNLQLLFLSGTRITDAGIPHLSRFPGLMVLGLGRTAVTGRGFKDFASHSNWHLNISLEHCPVDDEGLRQIVSVPGVSELDLSHTRITDAGLEYLDELVRSDDSDCDVYLGCTSISDAGFLRLRGAKRRLVLHAGGTAVTETGAADVTRRHPGYKVCRRCNRCRQAAETRREAMGPITVSGKDANPATLGEPTPPHDDRAGADPNTDNSLKR
jgi:hypothetical protein